MALLTVANRWWTVAASMMVGAGPITVFAVAESPLAALRRARAR